MPFGRRKAAARGRGSPEGTPPPRRAARSARANPAEKKSLAGFLEERSDLITERVSAALAASGTAYSRMPEPRLREAGQFVVNRGLIEAVRGDREHFRRFLSELATRRYQQGFPLADFETALTLLRREVLETLLRDPVDPPTLAGWLLDLWDVLDYGRLGVAEAYDRLHQEYSRDLESKVVERTRELAASHERLRQSEKLSALGKLISGVAHELNNPLTGVLGFSQLLLGAEVDEKVARQLKHIHEQGLRCQRIVKGLLAFSRRQRPEKKPVGLNGIVDSCLQLLEYPLRTGNIQVVKKLEPELPMICGDFHQLQQVVLNLIGNATQAIASSSGRGTVTISTRRTESGILLSVEDDGPGIPAENLSRIFDPFFTTKAAGEGTGLGLSICYGIAQEHGGVIRAASRPGQGARLTVELPVETLESELAQAAGGGALPAAPAQRRILVVDDELSILDLLYDALSAWGHRVDTAVNGETGLRKALRGSYDLILCDFKMPGIMGDDLYEKLLQADPHKAARVVFVTGELLDPRTQSFLEQEEVEWLEKPLDLTALKDFLSRWFARPSRPAPEKDAQPVA